MPLPSDAEEVFFSKPSVPCYIIVPGVNNLAGQRKCTSLLLEWSARRRAGRQRGVPNPRQRGGMKLLLGPRRQEAPALRRFRR